MEPVVAFGQHLEEQIQLCRRLNDDTVRPAVDLHALTLPVVDSCPKEPETYRTVLSGWHFCPVTTTHPNNRRFYRSQRVSSSWDCPIWQETEKVHPACNQ